MANKKDSFEEINVTIYELMSELTALKPPEYGLYFDRALLDEISEDDNSLSETYSNYTEVMDGLYTGNTSGSIDISLRQRRRGAVWAP